MIKSQKPFSLAIIGGGPTCTYVIERLAATLSAEFTEIALNLHVFEKSGYFGAGHVHSPAQPRTSLLNRVAGQIAFAADETNVDAEFLLPWNLRPTLHEWCARKYSETGDSRYNLRPEDWPQRRIHGVALVEHFALFVDILRRIAGVCVHLHAATVCDVVPQDGQFNLLTDDPNCASVTANHVLCLTGHGHNIPKAGSAEQEFVRFARQHPNVSYVPYAYPIESHIHDDMVRRDKTVACVGLGLTAIDVVLYLTEGREGRFIEDARTKRMSYRPSGLEPKKIVAVSRSGVFTSARPYNAKECDPVKWEHRGRFFTNETVDRLRDSVGIPVTLHTIGPRRQLDFERHLFPVVMVEMMFVYYQVLFGEQFAVRFAEQVAARFESFVRCTSGYMTSADGVAYISKPGASLVEEAVAAIQCFLHGASFEDVTNCFHGIHFHSALRAYLGVVLGADFIKAAEPYWQSPARLREMVLAVVSPWGHPLEPRTHVFSWQRLITPIERKTYNTPEEYTAAVIRYMEYDHQQAMQDNLHNPTKAACDGVWRDLRSVFAYAADFGGLTANSHRVFLEKYMRYHNRLANGACLQAMEKMLALVRAGLLVVSAGPRPRISVDGERKAIRIQGSNTEYDELVDTLIDAKLHPMDLSRTASPLFANLLRRGMIRSWRNVSADGSIFEPGGIDVNQDFEPIGADGNVTSGMTFLGAPTEGIMFFQIGAARPRKNHHVLNDVIHWMRRFRAHLLEKDVSIRRRESVSCRTDMLGAET